MYMLCIEFGCRLPPCLLIVVHLAARAERNRQLITVEVAETRVSHKIIIVLSVSYRLRACPILLNQGVRCETSVSFLCLWV